MGCGRQALSFALLAQLCSRNAVRAFAWSPTALGTNGRHARASLALPQGRLPQSLATLPRGRRPKSRIYPPAARPGWPAAPAQPVARLHLRSAASSAASAVTDQPDATWEIVRTPGDGSCLFHAVEVAAQQPAAALRAIVADAVEANVDSEFNGATLKQWIEWETELTPDQYSARMRVGNWGGQIELLLLARGLDIPIHVFAQLPQKGAYELQHTFLPASPSRASAEPIRLLYNGAHYDAIVRPGASAAAAAATLDGAAAPHGGALGQALVSAVQRNTRYKFGQVVDGFPMPKGEDHTATVIWLHGLGDSGFGWAPMSEQLGMPWVKFLFPTAPVQRVTLNMGMEMPAWFDLCSLDPDNLQEDVPGILESAAYVMGLVQKEIEAGIPPERIALVGFSQGGAIALTAALMMSELPFAGCVALSTWLPLFVHKPSPKGIAHPYLMCHGDADPVVQFGWGKGSYEKLKAMGAEADFKAYSGMDHNFCPEEGRDVAAFLRSVLPPK